MKNLILLTIFSIFPLLGYSADILTKNQKSNLTIKTESLEVPNNQATYRGRNTALIETGNDNLLVNPGFEHYDPYTGWTLSPIAPTLDITTPRDGKYTLCFTPSNEPLEIMQDSTLYASTFADGTTQGVISGDYKNTISGTNIYACPRKAGAITSECILLEKDGKWYKFEKFFTLGGTSNGISIHSDGYANVTSGTICVDKLRLAVQEKTEVGVYQDSDSYAAYDTASVKGSVNTSVMYLTNALPTKGDAVTGASTSTHGTSFTINEDGTYTINGTVNANNLACDAFLSRNATGTDLTGAPSASSMLVMSGDGDASFKRIPITWTGPLLKNDIIRLHTTCTFSGAANKFSISKQGTLKALNVNKNQKIKIPTSEIYFYNGNTRLADNTYYFSDIGRLKGDAFSYVSDATNGTKVKVKRSGELTVTVSLLDTANASSTFQVWRNEEIIGLGTIGSVANAAAWMTASWTGEVRAGDEIKVTRGLAPSPNVNNQMTLFFRESEVQVSVNNILPKWSENDLVVKAAGNGGQVITADVTDIPFSTIEDSSGGAWNGSQFVVPEDGIYNIDGEAYFTSGQQRGINLIINNSIYRRIGTSDTASTVHAFKIRDTFTKGQVLSLRGSNGGTLNSVGAIPYHWITITKQGKPNVDAVDVTPFVNVPQLNVDSVVFTGSTVSSNGSFRATTVDSAYTSPNYSKFIAVTDDATLGTRYRVLQDCNIVISTQHTRTSAVYTSTSIRVNGNILAENIYAEQQTNQGLITTGIASLKKDDVITVLHVASTAPAASTGALAMFRMQMQFNGKSEEVLAPTDTFSTDTANLQWSGTYNLTTLANAPEGTLITFSYAANGNTRTQCATAPTQTTDHMNVNGIQIFARAYNASSTCASPAAFAIQIGKGRTEKVKLYKSAGKQVQGSLDYYLVSNNASGMLYRDYSETTGIIILDAGIVDATVTSAHVLAFSDTTTQTNGYLVINASKSPALAGVAPAQQRFATIKDEQLSGVVGGTSVATAWQTRRLNKLEDPTGFVTMGTNQFTLQAGEYFIEVDAPAGYVDRHKARLRNITDGTTALVGTSEYHNATYGVVGSSKIKGRVVISAPKAFEIQHYTTLSNANGLGIATSSGEPEVYTTVKITKVK